ncbi:GDP-L-fucose synthase family protein [Telmatobacter bradus]|uniref:GDP-L-fucose synthase family protein n=1 Tax=Telmatobacter bradus TaxID=474953 RepID=UPI003B42A4F5
MSVGEKYSLQGKRIWVAGHRGMAGSAIVRRLADEQCEIVVASHAELDLLRQDAVLSWLKNAGVDAIFLAAAKVGGILANSTRPAEFIYQNLMIELNVIESARVCGVEKLLFLGSSCIYPRYAAQPMTEDMLLQGALEPTNESYAVAKIAGIKLCEAYRRQYGCDYISLMPTNLFGLGDRYDAEGGHVVAALIMKIHDAKMSGIKQVILWGTGQPKREFLYSGDLGDACVFAMKNYSGDSFLNVGTGKEMTIRELADRIAGVIGWEGEFVYDSSKPDGMPRKVMDVSRMEKLGWKAKTSFEEGMRSAYDWYLQHITTKHI